MTTKKEGRGVDATQAQTMETLPTNSIPKKVRVRNTIPLLALEQAKELREEQVITTVQELYPGFNCITHHYALRSNLYGVEICKDAMTALYAAYAPEMAPKPKKENRKLSFRIGCRVKPWEGVALKLLIKKQGYRTVQDWLSVMVRKALVEAAFFGTEEGGT